MLYDTFTFFDFKRHPSFFMGNTKKALNLPRAINFNQNKTVNSDA